MNLSQDDIERYAPYHNFAEFEIGYHDYLAGRNNPHMSGVGQQAYDRGAECAMRHQRRPFSDAS